MPGCTLPFKKGDVLQIKDSYYDFDPNTGGYKWLAVKAIGGGVYSQMREGSVPAEQRLFLSAFCFLLSAFCFLLSAFCFLLSALESELKIVCIFWEFLYQQS